MSQPIEKSKPNVAAPLRLLRWIGVLCGIAVLGAIVYSAEAYRGIQLVEADIKGAGGSVMFLPTFSQVMRERWLGEPFDDQTYVLLKSTAIDGAWLAAHDDLCELQIKGLHVDQTDLTAEDAAGLVQSHPLAEIVVGDIPDTDDLATALGRVPTLEKLNVVGSDLTDAGFAQLPLEQLVEIRVAHTGVSSAGLQELRRCQAVQHVVLDGRQLNAEVVAVLKELPNIAHLTLSGGDVTDDTLALLHGIKLRSLGLVQASTTKDGVLLFKTHTAGCRVNIGNRHVL